MRACACVTQRDACAWCVRVCRQVDLIEAYGELAFGLDFYTDVLDPSKLLPLMLQHEGSSAFARKHQRLNEAIVELVSARGLTRSAGSLAASTRQSPLTCHRHRCLQPPALTCHRHCACVVLRWTTSL